METKHSLSYIESVTCVHGNSTILLAINSLAKCSLVPRPSRVFQTREGLGTRLAKCAILGDNTTRGCLCNSNCTRLRLVQLPFQRQSLVVLSPKIAPLAMLLIIQIIRRRIPLAYNGISPERGSQNLLAGNPLICRFMYIHEV